MDERNNAGHPSSNPPSEVIIQVFASLALFLSSMQQLENKANLSEMILVAFTIQTNPCFVMDSIQELLHLLNRIFICS